MDAQFAAHANSSLMSEALSTRIDTQDFASSMYLQVPNNSTLDSEAYDYTLDSEDYDYMWSDPTDNMISTAHELTLRAAIATTNTRIVTFWNEDESENTPDLLTQFQSEIASPNLTFVNRTVSQDAEVTMTFEESVYKTQPKWLTAAFAVILLACISIVPTYWGWWHLGRPVSMSPLEIAKAFDAPLMQYADPNGSAANHLRTVGDMRVRYGYHATITEQRESDIPERLSYHPEIDSTSSTSAGKQGSNDDDEPNSPSTENGSASKTSVMGSTRPDDDIKLKVLHPEASSSSRMLSDQETTRRVSISSDPLESSPETQVYSSSARTSGTRPASSRIHTRIEMRLKFAED